MRLQKYLASCGVASRRSSEELIKSGKIKVNDKVIKELGTKVDPKSDSVTYNNKPVILEVKKLYLFNKPKGVLSSLKDPHHSKDLQKYISKTGVRAYPVGRLDKDAFGLMLLTNDGEFADKLLHPKYEIEREYIVLVNGALNDQAIKKAKAGVKLEDGLVKAKLKRVEFNQKYEFLFDQPKQGFSLVSVSLIEGRKHIVKRLMASFNMPVKELCRISHGPFKLTNLRPGQLEEVKNYEIFL